LLDLLGFQSPAAATAGLAATAVALYPEVGSLEQPLVIGSLAVWSRRPLVPVLGALATAWLGLNLTTCEGHGEHRGKHQGEH